MIWLIGGCVVLVPITFGLAIQRGLMRHMRVVVALGITAAMASCSNSTSTMSQTSISGSESPPSSLGSSCDLTAGIESSLSDLGADSFRAGLQSGPFDVCTATTVDGRDLVAIALSDGPLAGEQLRANEDGFDAGRDAAAPLDWGEIDAYVEANELTEVSLPGEAIRVRYRLGNIYGSIQWTGASVPTLTELEAFVRDVLRHHLQTT